MTSLVNVDLLDEYGENLGSVSLSRVPVKGERVNCDGVNYNVVDVVHVNYESAFQSMAFLWVEQIGANNENPNSG